MTIPAQLPTPVVRTIYRVGALTRIVAAFGRSAPRLTVSPRSATVAVAWQRRCAVTPTPRQEGAPDANPYVDRDRARVRRPPGTAFSYSNTNYPVLGLIVERATGRALRQELRRRIFKPLHLSSTRFPTSQRFGPRLPVEPLLGGRILPQRLLHEMRQTVPLAPGVGYGLGIHPGRIAVRSVVGA